MLYGLFKLAEQRAEPLLLAGFSFFITKEAEEFTRRTEVLRVVDPDEFQKSIVGHSVDVLSLHRWKGFEDLREDWPNAINAAKEFLAVISNQPRGQACVQAYVGLVQVVVDLLEAIAERKNVGAHHWSNGIDVPVDSSTDDHQIYASGNEIHDFGFDCVEILA